MPPATVWPIILHHANLTEAADAAMSTGSLYSSLPLSENTPIWASRVLVMMQTVAVPFTFWFRPVCITLAAFWLIYRAYQVLHTPLDDLAALLGFDIPPTPIIHLASIKADECLVHWSLPEKQRQKSKLKYEVHLNGVVLESVSIHEAAVTITGLQRSSFYVVRVALVNEQEFGSRSEPIRFRTKAASSGDCFVVLPDGHETDHDGTAETLPRVRIYRGLKDITPASIEARPMAREHSNSGLGPKRSITGRRPSPAALGLDTKMDPQVEESEPSEGTETIQQLTERLDAIRYETDETERQAKDEEEEESRLKEELTVERDALKAEAAEKERATRNLKREVNTLERQNTAAQNERSKHERSLQQKKQEREKLKQDMVRWEREAESMKQEAERIRGSKSEHLQQMEQERESLRAKQAEEATGMRSLEDEIKETNTSIKKLERAIKTNSPDGFPAEEPNLVQQMQQEAEEERQWQMHRANLQQQYTAVYQKLEAAKRFHTEQIRYLESVRAQRRRDEEFSAAQQQFNSPPPAERSIRRGDSQRSRRAPSGQSASDSPRIGGFAMVPSSSTQGPFPAGLTHPSAQNSSFPFAPFLNLQNGMTLRTNLPPTDDAQMTAEDKEKLTGGAQMSPGAGAELLPADLFSGDEPGRQAQHVMPLPGLGTLPGLPGLPGPVPTTVGAEREKDNPGPARPASPASGSSRSPSPFASPQASQHNLHLGWPDAFSMMDPDRRSIRSTRSNRAATGAGTPAASSRFSSMFGIKPRTKTGGSTDEGLALGKAQSHSMPRQDQRLPGLDSTSRKRNSSISGAFGPSADLSQHDGASDGLAETPASAQVSRRRAFGMGSIFGRDKDGIGGGWPSTFTAFGRRPGSPRPGSTHSNELPRPSMDSSRWGVDTWPSGDAAAGARSSPLSFTAGWPVPTQASGSRLYGSRHPSRRPSVQYGASGTPEDIMEDDDSDALSAALSPPHLAPIGTRPVGEKAERVLEDEQGTPPGPAPRMNPAAKDSKSFFGIKSKDKGHAGSPSTSTGASSSTAAGGLVPPSSLLTSAPRDSDHHDESPPGSRKSRSDARSITTTESSLADSGEANELARTPSYANFDATGAGGPSPLVGSGSTGKESFMQKITRKSSSSKFSLPTFKREKSRLDPSTSGSSTYNVHAEAEEEEGGMAASVGSLTREVTGRESKEGNRGSVRGWGNVLKFSGKSKRGGRTPSLSGLSLASGTEDGEEGEEEG